MQKSFLRWWELVWLVGWLLVQQKWSRTIVMPFALSCHEESRYGLSGILIGFEALRHRCDCVYVRMFGLVSGRSIASCKVVAVGNSAVNKL